MPRTDILLDLAGDGDLLIKDGDFVIGDSDNQNVKLILEADKGQQRFTPFLGVGIRRQLGGSVDGAVRRDIQLQLQGDGYRAGQIQYKNEVLTVDV